MSPHWNFLRQAIRGCVTLQSGGLSQLPVGSQLYSRLYSSSYIKRFSSAVSSNGASQLYQKNSGFPATRVPLLQLPQVSVSWCMRRTYAKKGKDKGGKPHKKMTLTSEQLEGVVDMEKVRHEFDHVLDDLREKFIHQLTVRTSQGVFDQLMVKTPDGNFPLIQLGQVIQKSPQLLTINMASSPQYIAQVKQALTDSGLNVNPQQDGTSLFIALPKVTREHRENLAKNAKMLSEQSKKGMRDIYSKYARKIKASKQGHSSDDLIAADDMVKDFMHSMIHQVENMTASKQKELLGGK